MIPINFCIKLTFIVCVFAGAKPVAADNSICSGSENIAITPTTPTSDFTIHHDGTVTHNTTGLMWMRCALGQDWDGERCLGFPVESNWQLALARALSSNFAGYSDWRLPNKIELESIIEERCYFPTINSQIFPNTISSWHWTSTPYIQNPLRAYSIHFGICSSDTAVKEYSSIVRLVRLGYLLSHSAVP